MAFEAQFLHEGNSIDFVAAAAIAAGEVVPVGTAMVGVASQAAAIGDTIGLQIEGVFEMAKEAPLVIDAGDAVFWDDVNNNIDKTDTNVPVGVAVKAAASADTKVWVKLVPAGA